MTKGRKIIFIGLDGVSWDVIRRSGAFNVIEGLAKRGCWGQPESIPPSTFPGWTTLTSGVNPGQHGLFEFTSFRISGTHVVTRINTSLDVMYPRMHEMLALKGLKSVVINLSPSFPPLPIPGVLISDWLSPRKFVYPKRLSWLADIYVEKPFFAHGEEFVKGVERSVESKVEIAKALFEQGGWTLFLIVFSEPDWLLHRHYDEVMASGGKSKRVLSKIDDFVRWVDEQRPPGSLVVIASDHGMGKSRFVVKPNIILAGQGLLKARLGGPEERPFKSAIELLHGGAYAKKRSQMGSFLASLARLLPFSVLKIIPHRPLARLLPSLGLHYTTVIDCSSSIAFMPDDLTYGVYINETLASPYNPQILAELLARGVKRHKLASSPLKLVAPRDDIYHGPFVRRAPHVVLVPNRGFELSSSLVGQPVEPLRAVGHAADAILIFSGDGIRDDGVKLKDVSMCDVVPTALHYLGLPVPKETDGRVLTDIFEGAVVESKERRADYLTIWRAWRKARVLRM